MNRRNFVKTSAGLLASLVMPGIWSCSFPETKERQFAFSTYRKNQTLAPVTQVTPPDGFYIHTFYDICPFSPSQRYLAVTRFPFQDREPELGDLADACVIDLKNETIKTVYQTKGWGFQLGANLNWGPSDRYLYTNDVIDGDGVCTEIDLQTNEVILYAGPMYHLAPDASCVIGFPLDLINVTQRGYGVPEDTDNPPSLPSGAAKDQGIWRTDLQTNSKELLVSLAEVAAHVPNPEYFQDGTFYFFHSKFNPQGTRVLQVVRCIFPENSAKSGWNPQLYTFNALGNDITLTVAHEEFPENTHPKWIGGNHPNWHPDGEHIIMNLTPRWIGDNERRFCMMRSDGSDFQILSKSRLGSGHPSVDPTTRYLITDVYPGRTMTLENGEVPIRLVDLEADDEEYICTISALKPGMGTLRVDPHPAWSRDYKQVCFNGAPEGNRQVFIADISSIV